MKILLDHCLPRRLKHHLSPHVVTTTAEMGWERLRNGALLTAAATQFDALLTIDKKLKYQQNLNTLPVSVVVIMAANNRFEEVSVFVSSVLEVLKTLPARTLVEVHRPAP